MPEPIDWELISKIVVPIIIALVTAWATLAAKRTQKGTRENAIIDQLQENIEAAETRSDKQDARMARIEAKVTVLERISRVRLDYIYVLRRHIENREPPPAPNWPDGIHD